MRLANLTIAVAFLTSSATPAFANDFPADASLSAVIAEQQAAAEAQWNQNQNSLHRYRDQLETLKAQLQEARTRASQSTTATVISLGVTVGSTALLLRLPLPPATKDLWQKSLTKGLIYITDGVSAMGALATGGFAFSAYDALQIEAALTKEIAEVEAAIAASQGQP